VNREKEIYIDPSYGVFESDKLFDLTDPILNRDDQLLPFNRLRENINNFSGITIHTADYLSNSKASNNNCFDYYSLGLLDKYEQISQQKGANLSAFIIMEPPVALPSIYKVLPKITAAFDRVYLSNNHGDGYSLEGVDVGKLNRFYWPIPYNQILEPYWSNAQRMKRVVVINGNHIPLSRTNEQYSLRIEAMAELARLGVIDLYGKGWDRWWSRTSMWMPYWLNRREIMSIYRGACKSKYEVLKNYEFCLCFENMSMNGYVTEKLFDCLYAGVIPLYIGAPNILDDIPQEVFVDCRNFSSWTELWSYVSNMSSQVISNMREAGREFIQGKDANKFYRSLENIFGI